MIDVIDKIIPMLEFRSEDDFYYLQILQRKKENDELGSNSRVIKNYYIGSVAYFEEHYEEIKSLCKKFNARAMLRLNRRSYEKTAFHTMINISNTIMNRDFKSVKACYDRACGQVHNESNKKWIVDIDDKNTDLKRIQSAIKFCMPNEGEDKTYCVLPTKNGYHIITSPFNVQQFQQTSRLEIDIHKDNPINLYIP